MKKDIIKKEENKEDKKEEEIKNINTIVDEEIIDEIKLKKELTKEHEKNGNNKENQIENKQKDSSKKLIEDNKIKIKENLDISTFFVIGETIKIEDLRKNLKKFYEDFF